MKKEKPYLQDNLISHMDIPYFKDFSKQALASISKVAVFRNYIPKNHIITEGKPCESAYLALKGRMNVFRTSYNGKKQVIARLGPGDWLNASCCLKSEEKNLASIVALTPARVLLFSADDFRRLTRKYPDLALKVMDNFSDRIKIMTNQIENLSLRSTSGRVAHFLLDHADDSGVIHWHCTQKDIADRIGTVADVVGRVSRNFADAGLIEMPVKHCIVIVNREGLMKEALN